MEQITLSFLINHLYDLGVQRADRLGKLVDSVMKISEIFSSCSWMPGYMDDGEIMFTLLLPKKPSEAEERYMRYVVSELNAGTENRNPISWMNVSAAYNYSDKLKSHVMYLCFRPDKE